MSGIGTLITVDDQPSDYPESTLACMDCGKPLPPGTMAYSRPLMMVGDSPVAETVCVECVDG